MLRYLPEALSEAATNSLDALTHRVMLKASRPDRYDVATRAFSAKRPRATFDEVKKRLAEVAPFVHACYYCERDRHRDIDHIEPKAIHPELAFSWFNYAFSCAICNQDAKRSKYAIVSADAIIHDCSHIIGTNDNLPDGISAFIDPRRETGLNFYSLDLATGILLVKDDIDEVSKRRANFTRATLDLNSDGLVAIRRQAYRGFVRYVTALADAVQAGDVARITELESEVAELGHPTVMVEAWRQRQSLGDFGDLLETLYERIGLSRWDGAEKAS